MSTHYPYDPPDRPVVGGITATFPESLRRASKGAAIEATKRVIRTQTYEPTGDVAFDTRAMAFRDAFQAGAREAFEESHEAFKTVGL